MMDRIYFEISWIVNNLEKIMKTSPSNTDKKNAIKQKMKNYTEEVLKKNTDMNSIYVSQINYGKKSHR